MFPCVVTNYRSERMQNLPPPLDLDYFFHLLIPRVILLAAGTLIAALIVGAL
jgi:hypothetical protein